MKKYKEQKIKDDGRIVEKMQFGVIKSSKPEEKDTEEEQITWVELREEFRKEINWDIPKHNNVMSFAHTIKRYRKNLQLSEAIQKAQYLYEEIRKEDSPKLKKGISVKCPHCKHIEIFLKPPSENQICEECEKEFDYIDKKRPLTEIKIECPYCKNIRTWKKPKEEQYCLKCNKWFNYDIQKNETIADVTTLLEIKLEELNMNIDEGDVIEKIMELNKERKDTNVIAKEIKEKFDILLERDLIKELIAKEEETQELEKEEESEEDKVEKSEKEFYESIENNKLEEPDSNSDYIQIKGVGSFNLKKQSKTIKCSICNQEFTIKKQSQRHRQFCEKCNSLSQHQLRMLCVKLINVIKTIKK